MWCRNWMYHTRECPYIGHCHCKPLPTPHRVFQQCNKNTGLHSPIHRNLVQYLYLELGVIHANFFQLKLAIVPIQRIYPFSPQSSLQYHFSFHLSFHSNINDVVILLNTPNNSWTFVYISLTIHNTQHMLQLHLQKKIWKELFSWNI